MRGHFLSIGIGVLFAGRFGRENRTVHQYSIVADDVFPARFRNYTVNIISVTIAWQIFTVYNVSGWVECAGYDIYTKYTLS